MDTTQSTTSSTVIPDEETKERIKNLALVGKAIMTLSSETGYETDFYVAKEALNKFKDGLLRLQLDSEDQKGMLDLITYLQKKIDRRMHASESGINGQ